MVRPLDTTLLSALSLGTRTPAFLLTIEDHVPHYTFYQTASTADASNDACVTSDNSVIRVQLTRGGSGFVSHFQFQRITDPAQSSQWSTWSTLPGSANVMFQDGGCAVANASGKLYAFAQRGTGGNDLYVWTSNNHGLSWTGPTTVLSPPGAALLKGIGSGGNDDVFFLYEVSGGVAIGCSFFYPSGGWTTLTTWTLPPLSSGLGIAVVWDGFVYTLIYSNGYSLMNCVFDFSRNTWTSVGQIAPSTNTAIGRISPRIFFVDGLYTLICIEQDSGVFTGSAYSYPRLRQSADLIHWSNGQIIHDLMAHYGAVAFTVPVWNSGSSGPGHYVATSSSIYRTPGFQSTNSLQYLDVSAAVLSYQRHEQAGKPAQLEVVLDNANGMYNALVSTPNAYRPIGLNSSVVLREGYKIGAGAFSANDTVLVGTYHLQKIQFIRSPQVNRLILVAQDLSSNLDLISRYQMSYLNQTLAFLIVEVCARAGIFSIALPFTSQMSQSVVAFSLQAGLTYRHALQELCSTYSLVYFLDQQEVMQFRELASTDPSVWTYQPEIETVTFACTSQHANHVIVSGKPPIGGLPGVLTTSEAYDDESLRLQALDRLFYHVDPKLTSSSQCSQKAAFLLAQQMRANVSHTVTVPLNPALQLFDGITLIDSAAPGGSGQHAACRIQQLFVRYAAEQAVAELQLSLEGM